jgi:hypothetical protein
MFLFLFGSYLSFLVLCLLVLLLSFPSLPYPSLFLSTPFLQNTFHSFFLLNLYSLSVSLPFSLTIPLRFFSFRPFSFFPSPLLTSTSFHFVPFPFLPFPYLKTQKIPCSVRADTRVIRSCGWIPNPPNLQGRDCFTRTGTNQVGVSLILQGRDCFTRTGTNQVGVSLIPKPTGTGLHASQGQALTRWVCP